MRRRAPLVAAAAVALAILWGAGDSLRPFATIERDAVQSTPGLGALDSRYTATLQGGDEACIEPVTLTPESQVARMRVLAPRGRPVPPVEITASAGAYRASGRSGDYAAGADQLVTVALDPPEGELRGKVCARNAGTTPVDLVGAQDVRSQVPARLYLNGTEEHGKDLELTLLERDRQSIAERPGDLISRARDLAPDYAPTWLLWILAILVTLGFPAAAIGGYYLVVSADRDDRRP